MMQPIASIITHLTAGEQVLAALAAAHVLVAAAHLAVQLRELRRR